MSWLDAPLDLTTARTEERDRFVRSPKSRLVHIGELNANNTWATNRTLCSKRIGLSWLSEVKDYSDYSIKDSCYPSCFTCFRRAYW